MDTQCILPVIFSIYDWRWLEQKSKSKNLRDDGLLVSWVAQIENIITNDKTQKKTKYQTHDSCNNFWV